MNSDNYDWMVDTFCPEDRVHGPRWRRRLVYDLVRSFYPTETWRTSPALLSNKREQGAATGHLFGHWQYMRQHLWSELPEEMRPIILGCVQTVKELLKGRIDKSLDAPLEDATPFFEGLASALKSASMAKYKPTEDTPWWRGLYQVKAIPTHIRGDSLTFQIKWLLAKEWVRVEKLGESHAGVPGLEKWLLEQLPTTVRQQHTDNSQFRKSFRSRLRQICHRCGLTLAMRGKHS